MRYGVLALLPSRRQSKIPVASARNQPMGMAIQMPLTPSAGSADRVYASRTRVPREQMVRTTDTAGRFTARK